MSHRDALTLVSGVRLDVAEMASHFDGYEWVDSDNCSTLTSSDGWILMSSTDANGATLTIIEPDGSRHIYQR